MMNHDDDILDNTKFANLCRHLKKAAIETPNLLAVAVQKYRSGGLSYDEIDFYQLDQQSDAIAYALNSYGIKRGMKAVLMVTPSLDFFALTFALFKAGIIPILVDPGMGVKNLKQCFIESSPDAFIGIPKAHIARQLFGWGKNSVKFLLTVGNAGFWGGISLANLLKRSAKQDINKPQNKPYPITWLDQDEMAAILFTSGSTGVPKGVVYSHKMFEAQINALKVDYGIISGERDLATFPLFSLFGPALGMASIVPDMDASKPITANPDYIFAAIEKYQCSNLFANPALIEVLGQAGKLNNHHLPSLKRVISAGAPATLSSIACFSKMLNEDVEVLNSYGATESLPLTKIGSKALLTTTAITDTGGGICVGNAVKGVEVTIIAITENDISQWDDNLCLPMNQIGEIVVKGPMVSQSYYQREIATKQAKIADYPLDDTLSANRQYRHRMGDLGYLDEQGQLWMCGRKAHRVQTRSDVVFSIPCERIFNTHAKVKRSALVGVKIKDKITPLLCIELDNNNLNPIETKQLFNELQAIGKQYQASQAIQDFLIHPDFPVDIRHNAKIFREKLAVWAQKQIAGKHKFHER